MEKGIGKLYAKAPGDFVAERDELAKRLTKAGDKDGAKRVKALRKPTAAAYAVNQLSRKHAADLRDLLDLGDQLRDAQQAMLRGNRTAATDVRDLSAKRRKAVDSLTKKALKLLGDGADGQRDAITNTLDAAVSSEHSAEAVRLGRLVKDLPAPSGFGDDDNNGNSNGDNSGDGGFSAIPEAEPSSREKRRAARHARDMPATAARGDGRAREEAEAAVDNRKHALAKATDEAQAAAREAAAARQEVSRLQDALVTANGKATAATERARRAQADAAQAQRALDDAHAALRSL